MFEVQGSRFDPSVLRPLDPLFSCSGLTQQLLGFFFNQWTCMDRLANANQNPGWQVYLGASQQRASVHDCALNSTSSRRPPVRARLRAGLPAAPWRGCGTDPLPEGDSPGNLRTGYALVKPASPSRRLRGASTPDIRGSGQPASPCGQRSSRGTAEPPGPTRKAPIHPR